MVETYINGNPLLPFWLTTFLFPSFSTACNFHHVCSHIYAMPQLFVESGRHAIQ